MIDEARITIIDEQRCDIVGTPVQAVAACAGKMQRPTGTTKGHGMLLDLSDDGAQLLREVLDIAVHDLNSEIASADLPSFRATLRTRRKTLVQILDAVGGPIPNAERLKR